MMDSLILDNFPPYTLTKITTSTHRQPTGTALRSSVVASKSKLPAGGLPSAASAAGFSGASASGGPFMSGSAGSGGGGAAAAAAMSSRPNHIGLQARTKIPMQGKTVEAAIEYSIEQ